MVRWDYLLDLLQRRGSPTRWRDWLSALFSTTSSGVLLNGVPGDSINHRRGLWQRDPLSPFLFILAIDPLQRLLEVATVLVTCIFSVDVSPGSGHPCMPAMWRSSSRQQRATSERPKFSKVLGTSRDYRPTST